MSIKSALLAGTAAIAMASPAFAGTGDAYISLFGGWSSLGEAGFDHYQRDSSTYMNTVGFIQRGRVPFGTEIVKTTMKGTFTSQKTFVTNFGSRKTGILSRTTKYTYQRSFSGEVGEEGFVIGAALGVDLMQGLRLEVEAAFRRYDLEQAGVLNSASFYQTYLRRDARYTYINPVPAFTGASNTHFKNPTKLYTHTTEHTKTFNNVATPVTYKTDFNVRNYWTKLATSNVPVVVEGELASFSFMINLWYDLPLGNSGIVPFIGGGVGVANLTLDYRVRTPSDIVFASGKYQEFYLVTKSGTSKTLMKNTSTRWLEPVFKSSTTMGAKIYESPGTVKSYNTVTNTNTLNYRTPRTFATTVGFSTAFKDDVAVFAYQFGAGLGYEFDNGLRLTAQYRYFATGEADFGRAGQLSVESSDVLLGVSFPLGRQRARN